MESLAAELLGAAGLSLQERILQYESSNTSHFRSVTGRKRGPADVRGNDSNAVRKVLLGDFRLARNDRLMINLSGI